MTTQTYLVALGGNRRSRWGSPRELLLVLLAPSGAERMTRVVARSRIHFSRPLGPGTRRYANAVARVETVLRPLALLTYLQAIERAHGRRAGRRWGDRVLDLDIIGWSGGIWRSRLLDVPHRAFRERRFVLAPLAEVAPDWRDPVTGWTARQLLARHARRRRE